MNTMTLPERLELLAKWARGEVEVQRTTYGMQWATMKRYADCSSDEVAKLLLCDEQLRPKPARTIRPWKFDEVPVGKEVKYANAVILTIESCEPILNLRRGDGHLVMLKLSTMHQWLTNLDGSPCGVEVEGE